MTLVRSHGPADVTVLFHIGRDHQLYAIRLERIDGRIVAETALWESWDTTRLPEPVEVAVVNRCAEVHPSAPG
jgi:hypothetical protein